MNKLKQIILIAGCSTATFVTTFIFTNDIMQTAKNVGIVFGMSIGALSKYNSKKNKKQQIKTDLSLTSTTCPNCGNKIPLSSTECNCGWKNPLMKGRI